MLVLGAAAVLASSVPAPADRHEEQIDERRRRQEEIRGEQVELARQKAEAAAEIDALNADDQNLVDSLADLDRFLALQEAYITKTELLIDQHEGEAATARIEAERLADEIEDIREQLRQRAIDAFVQPPAHVVDPLASEDFGETARRQFLLNQVIGDELEIVDQLRVAESALEEARRDAFQQAAAADEKRGELSQELADLERFKAAAEKQREQVQDRIAALVRQGESIDAADAAMGEEIRGIDAEIEEIKEEQRRREEAERRRLAELERKRRAEEAARKRAEEEARRRAEEAERREQVGLNPGEFFLVAWPSSGEVVSGFGPRLHPIFGVWRNHNGIDLDGDTGDPVRAALVGEVIIAGWRNGFGNTVVLNHFDGYTTLYAHLSKISVSVGEEVDHGERIGSVGSTGWSTGPHLHFEIRVNGKAVDPMPYMP